MINEAFLQAVARSLIKRGNDESLAREMLVEKYPDCEGTILTMDIFAEPLIKTNDADLKELFHVEETDEVEDLDVSCLNDSREEDDVEETVKPVVVVETVKPVEVVAEPVETLEKDVALVIGVAKKAKKAKKAKPVVVAEPVVETAEVIAESVAETVELVTESVKDVVKVGETEISKKGRKLLNPNSKMGKARFYFLNDTTIEVEDFAKALIANLDFEKYDAKLSAKIIIKEFNDGKFA